LKNGEELAIEGSNREYQKSKILEKIQFFGNWAAINKSKLLIYQKLAKI